MKTQSIKIAVALVAYVIAAVGSAVLLELHNLQSVHLAPINSIIGVGVGCFVWLSMSLINTKSVEPIDVGTKPTIIGGIVAIVCLAIFDVIYKWSSGQLHF